MVIRASPGPFPSLPTLPAGFNVTHSFSDKLDRNTYLSWKVQFQAILTIHDLTYILDPANPISSALLSDGKPNPDFPLWQKVDTLVLSWIRATATSSIQPLILPCKTALEAWTLLERRLSPNSRVHIKSLRDRLHNLKKKPDLSMLDYLLSAKSLADELAAVGQWSATPISSILSLMVLGRTIRAFSLLSLFIPRPPLMICLIFYCMRSLCSTVILRLPPTIAPPSLLLLMTPRDTKFLATNTEGNLLEEDGNLAATLTTALITLYPLIFLLCFLHLPPLLRELVVKSAIVQGTWLVSVLNDTTMPVPLN